MTYSISVRGRAERDIEEKVEWYRTRAPEQVLRFLGEIDAVKVLIRDSPGLYPAPYRSTHRAPLSTFPHFLWYRVDHNARHIRVLAVSHHRQDPDRIRRRLR